MDSAVYLMIKTKNKKLSLRGIIDDKIVFIVIRLFGLIDSLCISVPNGILVGVKWRNKKNYHYIK